MSIYLIKVYIFIFSVNIFETSITYFPKKKTEQMFETQKKYDTLIKGQNNYNNFIKTQNNENIIRLTIIHLLH